jgi:8-oxo-dGTP diphosphatase
MHKDLALIFFYKDNKILFQDRRNSSTFGEEWGFFGGHIERGETPAEAVVRETKEELTFSLKKFRFIQTSQHHWNDWTCTVHAFAAPLPKLSSFTQKEGQGMKLLTEKEALALKFNPPDYDIIRYVFAFLRQKKD